jgi:kynurenine formamidase
MRIIDLSSTIDSTLYEADPVTHEVLTPAQGVAHMSEQLRLRLGIEFDPAELPDSEFLSLDRISLTTHTGTHVDAPSHYGSRASYGNGTPRHIDEMPLDWFYRPGVVLDLKGHGTGTVGAAHLEKEFARIGYTPAPMDVVLLNTGASEHAGSSPTTCTTLLSRKASGLGGRVARPVSAAMLARRVRAPVVTTMAVASPSTTWVPAWTGEPRMVRTGLLSPVSMDSSTASPADPTTSASAHTRSPAASRTTSPSTSSAASTMAGSPSRRTFALVGNRSRSFCAARSARYSWAKANSPLSTTTTAMAMAMAMATDSSGIPAR